MPTGNGHGTKPKVLVVDDNDAFRRSTARILTRAGYTCIDAAGTAQALVRLDSEPDVSVLLCDIRMPGQSGLDLLRQMVENHPDIAVLMTTGIDDPVMVELAFDLGAYGYLIKPFESNELLINVDNAVKRRDLESEHGRRVQALEHTMAGTQAIAGVISGIDRRRAEPDDDETIALLAKALALRDDETALHIERMSRYTALIGESVGFRMLAPEDLRLAAALHDVGKIGIPDSILLKPGALSSDEYSAMQRHSMLGYQLLAQASSDLLAIAGDIALGHHEWWDGGGYPRGLRGDDISEVARIGAVADVFDALTSNRVYRPAMPVDEALATMMDARGTQFEPRMLDAFAEAIDEVLDIRESFSDKQPVDTRVRILLVDDHEVFAQSLVRLLESKSGVKVVGIAGTVAEARTSTLAYRPDVVLMDFELPDGDGPEATEAIKALVPDTKVVMLTGRTDERSMVRAIEAGCSSFVTKTSPADTVLEAINLAHAGETLIPVSTLGPLLGRLRPTHRGLGTRLAHREVEVLDLVAAGLANRQIGNRLGLSAGAVDAHLHAACEKLQAHSKLEAVATAVREGVIHVPMQVASH